MEIISESVILRHGIKKTEYGLSTRQKQLLNTQSDITIVSAPTGSGKTYTIQKAIEKKEWIIFVVPTKILGQTLYNETLLLQEKNKNKNIAEKTVFLFNSDQVVSENQNKTLYRWDVFSNPQKHLGGGIIFITPETLSSLIMNPQKYLNNGTIETIIRNFDRIVFDEVHTIEYMGFGLLTSLCRLAVLPKYKENGEKYSAKIQLLSATPINFIDILLELNIPKDSIEIITEEVEIVSYNSLGEENYRILHGDVNIKIVKQDLKTIISENWEKIQNNKNKTVSIYNSLNELTQDKMFFKTLDVQEKIGYISSIDSQENYQKGINIIDTKNIIFGTSSLDVGITIQGLNLLIMNIGMTPLQFMQRIGRVARGDLKGEIIISISENELIQSPWKKDLIEYLQNNKMININSLIQKTCSLSNNMIDDNKITKEEDNTNFYGSVSTKAIYCSSLYWYNIQQRYQYIFKDLMSQDRLNTLNQIKQLNGQYDKTIYSLIENIKKNYNTKHFLDSFLKRSLMLRNFDNTVVLHLNDDGRKYKIILGHNWASIHTYAFNYNVIDLDKYGVIHIDINDKFENILRDKNNKGQSSTKTIYKPDGYILTLKNNYTMINEYYNLIKNTKNINSRNKKSIESGVKLIMMTGIIPYKEIDNVLSINETKADIL